LFQFSRAIYRALAPDIDVSVDPGANRAIVEACDRTIERLVTDRRHFARPSRSLYMDIRPYFPVSAQAHVLNVVQRYLAVADDWLAHHPPGQDIYGRPLQCPASTRRGTPCRRTPSHANGYCPSHQHLAETDEHDPSFAFA
jgi:hypothetical protein